MIVTESIWLFGWGSAGVVTKGSVAGGLGQRETVVRWSAGCLLGHFSGLSQLDHADIESYFEPISDGVEDGSQVVHAGVAFR